MVHALPAARASAIVVAVRSLLPKRTRNLRENSKNSWHADHPAGQCTKALGDTCFAAREVSLDTLHRSARAGRNGNKHAMVPTRQGVLRAAASENDAAAAALGAMKPTAVDDDDGICRRACHDHHHDALREPFGSHRRTPGRYLAA